MLVMHNTEFRDLSLVLYIEDTAQILFAKQPGIKYELLHKQ